jgi:hypothetical protein
MALLAHNQRLIDGIRSGFVFESRPDPIPPDMRPQWRIAILLMALVKCGWAGRMSLKKAHVLNWAVRGPESREALLRMLRGELELEDVVVRFDPAFNRALDFAVGERLVALDKKSTGLIIQILPAGRKLVATVEEHSECMAVERAFFEAAKKVPQHKIEELLGWATNT